MDRKISAFYIMTEPEKMGYPYLESIIATLSIVDEVVLIMGRDEEESEIKISALARSLSSDKEIKIVKTNSWPENDWGYDVMRDHIQRGLDECTHDICLKIDCDYVFRDQYANDIRNNILSSLENNHMISFGRINVFTPAKGAYVAPADATPCYIINKTTLRNDGITWRISNESGSNQPFFEKKNSDDTVSEFKDLRVIKVGEVFPCDWKSFAIQFHVMCPLNYSYMFMDAYQIAKTWAAWHKAVEIKFGASRVSSFDAGDTRESFKNFLEYHVNLKVPLAEACKMMDTRRSAIWEADLSIQQAVDRGLIAVHPDGYPLFNGAMQLIPEYHPHSMQKKLCNIATAAWGYDNFGHRERIEWEVEQMHDRRRAVLRLLQQTQHGPVPTSVDMVQPGLNDTSHERQEKQEIMMKWVQYVIDIYLSSNETDDTTTSKNYKRVVLNRA